MSRESVAWVEQTDSVGRMLCYRHYTQAQLVFALTVESEACEAHFEAEHQNYWGTAEQYEAATERSERLDWWLGEVHRITPGVTTCEHGLSYQLCAGPGHYPPDYDAQW